MTSTQWKKIARLLKEVYAQIEQEAIQRGVDIFSDEYTELLNKARANILNKMGFTEEEYLVMKEEVAVAQKSEVKSTIEKTKEELQSQIDELKAIRIPTEKEIENIAHNVSQEYIKAPQITNQIVKEITHEKIIEQPKIIETVRVEQKTERVEYNDKPLKKELENLNKKIEEIKIPEIPDVNSIFQENFKKNIDILGMPDFRKLGMGLQGQIDDLKNDLQDDSSIGETFETVAKNLKAYPATFAYTGDVLNTITYDLGGGLSITKTYNRTGNLIDSIVLSGDTPSGISLTKTFNRTGDIITNITYS